MNKLKIGLEIHGSLTTKEKLFCNCNNSHKNKESEPNTNICPTCTGQPGSKPALPNEEAIKKIIQIALMLNCKINSEPLVLTWWRKHYNWPDLPKGYQNTISGTYATHVGEKGEFEGIRIREVHLEEDPAAWNPETGTIDYNRSGSPLVEIVTEPDFSSANQVREWINKLVLTLSYINALDKDSGIKADVNVSLTGDRIEIKNINSISEITKAIIYEEQRQKKEKPLLKETRAWDGKQTIKMRNKEGQEDYRFIKDPDIPVIKITKKEIQEIKKNLPEPPMQKLTRIIKENKIRKQDAEVLIQNLEIVEFFEKTIEDKEIKSEILVPWVTVELIGTLNYNKKSLKEISLNPEHFIDLIKKVQKKELTKLKALEILRKWIPKGESSKIETENIEQISDKKLINEIIEKVILENKKAVEDYKSGKQETINFLIGQVMKLSNKRANYQTTKELLQKELK